MDICGSEAKCIALLDRMLWHCLDLVVACLSILHDILCGTVVVRILEFHVVVVFIACCML